MADLGDAFRTQNCKKYYILWRVLEDNFQDNHDANVILHTLLSRSNIKSSKYMEDDFSLNNVEVVDGWILSASEAKACVWASLHRDSL